MQFLAASFLETSGMSLSLICAVIGLGFAIYLIKTIVSSPAGNARMKEIAAAIEEGAKAYLARQVRSIAMIAVVITVLVAWFKDMPTAIGFVLGAVCSLAAGFIGMRIAVLANVRTAQGATDESQEGARRGIQRRGGHGLARGRTRAAFGRHFLAGDEQVRAGRRRSRASSASRSARRSSRCSRVSAAAFTRRRRMWARTWSARSSRTWTKTIHATRRRSRTTSATMSAIAPAWRRMFLKPTPCR